MYKIGINIDSNLKEILEELMDIECYKINECNEDELKNLDIFLIDIQREKDDERIEKFKINAFITIALISKEIDLKRVRKLFKNKIVYDCIYKNDYFEIENIINEIMEKPKKRYELILNDPFYKAIVDSRDIIYINYCRISRKTEIVDKIGKIYTIKKSFSDVEESLNSLEFLFRLDRGTIINKNLVKELDYKGEIITFNGGKKLSISRSKLKILEENINLFKNRIEL